MKRALQIALAALAVIPAFFALSGLIGGAAGFEGRPVSASLDNQLRYLSGVYLIVPLLVLKIIPRIEREGGILMIVVAALVIGGVGRLVSMLTVGDPGPVQVTNMALEFGSVLLIPWQRMVANQENGR